MKVQAFCVASALVAEAAAVTYSDPRNDTLPKDRRELSVRGKNIFERQSNIDYCGLSSYYYCLDASCCGINSYSCVPAGGECCADLSTFGYGLWCAAGSSCTVIGGYVQCEDTSGNTFSAGSSAADFSSTDGPTSTDAGSQPTGTSGSSSSSSKSKSSTKKKSKVWIAGAVAGPLIIIAVIAIVVFFLFMQKKKQQTLAANNATIIANQQNMNNNNNTNAAAVPPPMAQTNMQPPQQPPPPTEYYPPNPDSKTPAYTTQQYVADVPTPINSPPPQWAPPSPAPIPVSPLPAHAQPHIQPQPQQPPTTQQYAMQHSFTSELHGNSTISPMNTGNVGGAGPFGGQPAASQMQMQTPRGNAMELPSTAAAVPPRNGAHEMG